MGIPPRIVILGGGFAGVAVAQELQRRLPAPRAQVHLVSQENFFLFHPMLPEVAGGSIEPHHILNPLRQLCPRATVSVGVVEAIDLERQRVEFVHGPHELREELSYDFLVLAVGAVTNFSELTGMAQHAFGLKTVGDALYLRNHVLSMLEEAEVEDDPTRRRELLTFVVVGGGFSGVETVAEINDFVHGALRHYRRLNRREVRVVLVHAGPRLLPELGEDLAARATTRLRRRGVEVRLNTMLASCTEREAGLQGGDELPTRTLMCTIGTAPNPLLERLPCPRDERGRVRVTAELEVEGWPGVWALGDCAAVPNSATGGLAPPTAQFAEREGKLVAHNIVATLEGGARRAFRYPGLGQFVSVGHRFAVATIGGVPLSGFPAWWLWRTFYLLKLPSFVRKLRVASDWTLDLLFGRDIVHVPLARGERLGRAHYEPGDVILQQGDPADLFYVITDGEVEVVREGTDGSETVLARLGPGEHFGEMALLQGRAQRNATVRALSPVNVVTLGRDDFTVLAHRWEGLRQSLLAAMRQRSR